MEAALSGRGYFSDAVAQDSTTDMGAGAWNGREQWNNNNNRRSRRRGDVVDDFARALFGF
jgi:hypothetical protein